ncbi:MAG: hypothetical protein AAF456_00905 [Planctomycetota bacterium]
MSQVFPDSGGLTFEAVWKIIRSPFSPEFDWETQLSESGLPDRVQSVVYLVVQRSGLMRYEKSAVAEDLIDHFLDGEERGVSFSKLIAEFGQPETAATLIRSSKLRSRPVFSKILRGGMWAGLAGILGYLGLAAFFHMGKPNPSVNYLFDLNEDIALIAEEDRAWNVYRESWTNHEFSEGPGGRFEEIYFRSDDPEEDMRYVRSDDGEQWDRAVEKLRNSQDLLDALREGAMKPSLGVELQSNPMNYSPEDRAALFPGRDLEEASQTFGVEGISEHADQLLTDSLVGILLPHIQSFRNASRILIVDTRWAIDEGDFERATQNIEATFGFARQASESPVLVCGLVGVAVYGIGCDLTDEILATHESEFSDDQMRRIQEAVSRDPAMTFIKLHGERAMVLDILQRVYTDDGNGDGRITPDGMDVLTIIQGMLAHEIEQAGGFEGFMQTVKRAAAPVALAFMPGRRDMTDAFNMMFDKAEDNFYRPLYEYDIAEIEEEVESLGHEYFLLKQLVPAYQQIRLAMFRTVGNQGGMEMAIAAYRYRRAYGEFPETADQLVGEFLDEIGEDPVDGSQLKYKRTEDSFIVYSLGVDADDDGGEAVLVTEGGFASPGAMNISTAADDLHPQRAGEFSFTNSQENDGDWVIWPRYSDN